MSSIFIPAPQIGDARANWISGLALQLGSPELVPSPSDVREGAYLEAGIVTDHRTADFHTDWTDMMDSANWWLSTRLMARPNAALTDGDGLTLSIPVPSGRRHVWIEYFASVLGGSLRVSGAVRATEIVTQSDSLGSFRWIDLGWEDGGRELRITSVRGFNAVGEVAMLTSAEVAFDEQRFQALT
jgi:hypothetical protein